MLIYMGFDAFTSRLYHGHITFIFCRHTPHTHRTHTEEIMAILKRAWKDGRVTYRVQVYHKQKVVADGTFDTKIEATRFETEIKAKVQQGTYVNRLSARQMSLSDAIDKYTDTKSREKKGDTYTKECSQGRQIKKHSIAKLPLSSISSSDIAKFRDNRSKEVGSNSVRLAIALISHIFTTAKLEWEMPYLENPCLATKSVSVKNTHRDRRLEDDEYDRLMRSAGEYRNRNMQSIIIFAIETAMRQGEIAAIKFDWIDFDNHIVNLPDTKNGEARSVPLSSTAFAILTDISKSGHTPVFNMTASAISKAFTKICRRAKDDDCKKDDPIINLHFHDLRHEATTRLFEKGLSTEQVMSITGHKTYSMLAQYTHLKTNSLVKLLG